MKRRNSIFLSLTLVLTLQFTSQQAFAFGKSNHPNKASTSTQKNIVQSLNLPDSQFKLGKSLDKKNQILKITPEKTKLSIRVNDNKLPNDDPNLPKEIKSSEVAIPSIPQNLITSRTDSDISLYWDASLEATTYDIEIDGKQIVSSNELVYKHTSLTPDIQHTYRVRAKNLKGCSNWSETITEKTLPTGVTAPAAVISMKYDDKSFTFTGCQNVNTDASIFKTTKINWTSLSIAPPNETISDTEWINKNETYTSYQDQIVRLRVKSSSGIWSDWAQIKFKPTNRAPIAELKYAIMNPESVVNGNITPNTKIAWLWSYNGQNYTYDPDGDSIANVQVDGIPPTSILGNLSGNIGFATQFSTPAQYIMRFKCKDSQGLWSNEWSIIFNVEPADGNHRPECVINYSTLNADTKTQIVWGWFNSKDPDPNDSIAGVEASVIKDGQYYDINKFKTGQDKDGIGTKFTEAGQYTVMFRVKDTHGAWSNWTSSVVTIKDAIQRKISNLVIRSNSDDDYKYFNSTDSPYGLFWIDDAAAAKAVEQNNSLTPNELLKTYSLKVAPKGKPVSNGFTVSGKVEDINGTPITNSAVAIAFPLNGKLIKQVGSTDNNGNFSLSISANEIPKLYAKYTFISNYCTNYYEPSTLHIICGGVDLQESILVNTNVFSKPINVRLNMPARKSIFLARRFVNVKSVVDDWYDINVMGNELLD